jgi:L-cysteine:1D-myo-inositol 2-amino-2-deoxy-alpha-D-glucopyranoside ligase
MCAAQAQVLSGKPLAGSYVHAGMIGLDGEKMSKSKGNLVFVSKLVAAGRDPMAIRWALMKDHYRTDRMWNDELLVAAEKEISKLRDILATPEVAPTSDLIQVIANALANDLDTQSVIKAINDWAVTSDTGVTGGDSKSLAKALDSLLGIKL